MRENGNRVGPAIGLLAVLAAALTAEGLLSGGAKVMSSRYQDLPQHFLPWLEFGFGEIRKGNFPFWNPRAFSGTPFFGAWESALLYPPNWLHLILSPGAAINAVIALHLFLAGLFTFLWSRRRGVSPAGSLLAGAVFMLSGPFFTRIFAGHMPPVCAMPWAAAILWALDGLIEKPSAGWALAGAACVGLQILAGNPQFVYYTGLAALIYGGLRLRDCPRPGAGLAGLAAVYAGGAALAAVQILPGLAAARESVRGGGVAREFAAQFALPWENFLTFLVPGVFGDLTAVPYFGRGYLWEFCLFVGVSSLALAAFAFKGKASLWRAPALSAAAVLLLALGARLPIYDFLFRFLPGYALLRGTAKFGFLAALFLAHLAGQGHDRLKESASNRKPPAAALAVLSLLLAAGGIWTLAQASQPDAGNWPRLISALRETGETYLPGNISALPEFARESAAQAGRRCLGAAAVALAAAAALIFLTPARAARALAGLAVAELLVFSMGARTFMRYPPAYPAAWKEAVATAPPDSRFLHIDTALRNRGMSLGFDEVLGYSQLSPRRYLEFISWTQGLETSPSGQYPPITRLARIFSMLRLRTVFMDDKQRSVATLPSPFPRFLLLGDWTIKKGREEIFEALGGPDFNPKKTVILEREPVPAPAPGANDGTVRLVKEDTDSLEIEAELKNPAILLITDAFAQGWAAKANAPGPQNEYEVLPANFVLRAIPLAAGRHHFTLEYTPKGLKEGRAISLAALLCLLAFGAKRALSRLVRQGKQAAK